MQVAVASSVWPFITTAPAHAMLRGAPAVLVVGSETNTPPIAGSDPAGHFHGVAPFDAARELVLQLLELGVRRRPHIGAHEYVVRLGPRTGGTDHVLLSNRGSFVTAPPRRLVLVLGQHVAHLAQRDVDAVKIGTAEQVMALLHAGRHRPVHHVESERGQHHRHVASVGLIRRALDEALRLQPAQPIGDRGGREQQQPVQVARQHPERRPGAAQRREQKELPPVQAECRRRPLHALLQNMGQPREARRHRDRLDVGPRLLAGPRAEHRVDRVDVQRFVAQLSRWHERNDVVGVYGYSPRLCHAYLLIVATAARRRRFPAS